MVRRKQMLFKAMGRLEFYLSASAWRNVPGWRPTTGIDRGCGRRPPCRRGGFFQPEGKKADTYSHHSRSIPGIIKTCYINQQPPACLCVCPWVTKSAWVVGDCVPDAAVTFLPIQMWRISRLQPLINLVMMNVSQLRTLAWQNTQEGSGHLACRLRRADWRAQS